MIDFRNEILKALPIPDFFMWWWNNWPGFGFHVWADELLEMEKEGIVKIERGGEGGVGGITENVRCRGCLEQSHTFSNIK